MMVAIRSSETFILTIATMRNIPDEDILRNIFLVMRFPNCCILCDIVFLRSLRRWLVTANVVTSLPILVTLMMEALRSYETLRSYKSHTA
jgi:hypothetical protein